MVDAKTHPHGHGRHRHDADLLRQRCTHHFVRLPKGEHTPPPDRYGEYERRMPGWTNVDPPTDDWPYLYLAARAIPTDYVVVIVSLVVGSLLALICVRGRGFASNDAHFLSLGFGFMLLQTTSIAKCSLYFGSTWFVTMLVVAGVLLMVLAANLVAIRMSRFSFWLYLPLLAAHAGTLRCAERMDTFSNIPRKDSLDTAGGPTADILRRADLFDDLSFGDGALGLVWRQSARCDIGWVFGILEYGDRQPQIDGTGDRCVHGQPVFSCDAPAAARLGVSWRINPKELQ